VTEGGGKEANLQQAVSPLATPDTFWNYCGGSFRSHRFIITVILETGSKN